MIIQLEYDKWAGCAIDGGMNYMCLGITIWIDLSIVFVIATDRMALCYFRIPFYL